MWIFAEWPINIPTFSSIASSAPRSGEISFRLKCFAGIGRNHGIPVLAAGGISNHSHLLIALPANVPVAKAVQVLKALAARALDWSLLGKRDTGHSASAVRTRRQSRITLNTRRNTIRSDHTKVSLRPCCENLGLAFDLRECRPCGTRVALYPTRHCRAGLSHGVPSALEHSKERRSRPWRGFHATILAVRFWQ